MSQMNTTPLDVADLQPLSLSLDVAEPSFHIKDIPEADVLRIITALKTSKAKDVYEMDTAMLKGLSTSLVSSLTKILNQSFSQGIFLSAWKMVILTPLFF